ncbi:TadE/TadG family type IV pilus assembly protein [Caloramator sp. ALD01]|uniref:TadE/TadG family type IV pilus assembly protein n=1 Tax=Caloramator sp. ALD01 TaxID=1031288 RepID=UPI0004865776|nr:pilus assembly protein TadG-related protein [Caloramator sp. ALD01]
MKKRGNAAIIILIMFAALLSFSAYVIDVGIVYAEKIKLENAIDAACLSAALELPSNPQRAEEIAKEYLEKNGVDPKKAQIAISEDNKSIEIRARKQTNHIFAKIFGINKSTVYSKSKAILGPAKSVKGGVRPFGVVAYDFTYGDLVTLKEEAGDGYHGNYNVLAIGGQGANVFYINAMYGYDGVINVGDMLDTEPGNMAGVVNDLKNYINSENSTFENYKRDSIRLWTIPLVNTMEVNGRKKVLVVGFAQFFVEDIYKKSGKAEIKGRFIKYVTNAEIDMSLNDTGVYGVKLSR